MKIAIVDYGAGNLPSVERALRGLGAETERATEPAQIAAAKAIVLPGVGHFSAFVNGLRERNLTSSLREAYECGVPILGICLGLQAMFASSEEAPGDAGPRLFPGGSSRAADKREVTAYRLESVARARKPARCFEGFPRMPTSISRILMRRRLRLNPRLRRAITASRSRRSSSSEVWAPSSFIRRNPARPVLACCAIFWSLVQ